MTSLQKFFKAGVQKQCDKETLDQIINSIQFLVHGIVQLHEIEKKEKKKPELEVLIHEIDTSKVQQLVEMGFSQSDAVDALLVHTSVPEAAEYLIAMESNTHSASVILRAVTSTNVSTASVTPSTNISSTTTSVPLLPVAQTSINIFSSDTSISNNENVF